MYVLVIGQEGSIVDPLQGQDPVCLETLRALLAVLSLVDVRLLLTVV